MRLIRSLFRTPMVHRVVGSLATILIAFIVISGAASILAPLALAAGSTTRFDNIDVVEVATFSLGQAGVFPTGGAGAKINDWAPTGLATRQTLEVQAGDNWGTLITGIDAVGAGLPVRSTRRICNTNAPEDAGIVALSTEDTGSVANNRIWTPGFGRLGGTTSTERYYIGPSSCVDLIYMQPDQADATVKRWVLIAPERQARITTQGLGFFPSNTPAAITGVVENWDPVNACPAVGGPINGSMCEGAGSLASVDYTSIVATTVDGTGATLGGLKQPGNDVAAGLGAVKIITNGGPGIITVLHHSGGSSPANWFDLPGGISMTIPAGGQMMFFAPGSGAWIPVGSTLAQATSGSSHIVCSTNQNTLDACSSTSGVMYDSGTAFVINGSITIPHDKDDPNQIEVELSGTGRTAGQRALVGNDTGTYDTTGGPISNVMVVGTTTATRSAGGNNLTGVGAYFSSSAAQVNFNLQTGDGTMYLGLGGGMALAYVNATSYIDFSAAAKVETTLTVGGGDFTATTRQQLLAQSTLPTVNHGSLSADSGNWRGQVTGIGANTSVTLTYGAGGFGTSSHCMVTVEGATPFFLTVTPSSTAPVINCFDAVTGVAANCPDFTYDCTGH